MLSPHLAASRRISPRLAASRRVSPRLAASRCVSLHLAVSGVGTLVEKFQLATAPKHESTSARERCWREVGEGARGLQYCRYCRGQRGGGSGETGAGVVREGRCLIKDCGWPRRAPRTDGQPPTVGTSERVGTSDGGGRGGVGVGPHKLSSHRPVQGMLATGHVSSSLALSLIMLSARLSAIQSSQHYSE